MFPAYHCSTIYREKLFYTIGYYKLLYSRSLTFVDIESAETFTNEQLLYNHSSHKTLDQSKDVSFCALNRFSDSFNHYNPLSETKSVYIDPLSDFEQ